MRELAVQAFVTLDGVMQAPGGPEEDPTGGFTAGGWSVPFWDADIEQSMTEAFEDEWDLILGRKTYEIFAAHWPYSGDEMGRKLTDATKYVASTTLTEFDWENTELIEGEVAEGVRKLKEADGPELQTQGSAHLIQTLLANDLVDEIRVLIYPIVVGPGKRLFGDGTIPRRLELTDSRTTPSGVSIARYRRVGDIEIGSFAREDPTDAEVERRERMAGE